MSHGSGLYMIPYVSHVGVNVVPESGGFDAAEIFELIEAWPRASMFAAPTMVKRLVEHDGDVRAENIRTIVWGGAIAGVLQSLLWVTAPKPLIAVIYVVLGWSILPYLGAMHATVGAVPLWLMLVGGVVYSLGALVYAKKRPDPAPAVFGYHEVFHALVIAAASLHFAAVSLVVTRA